jgi:hypothetical protein
MNPAFINAYSLDANVTIAAPLRLLGEAKEQPTTPTQPAPQEKPKQKKTKHTGIKIAKCEIETEKLKFFNAKRFFKKRWVVAKEFPIAEISEVDAAENWMSLKWNGATYAFLLKRKTDTFAKVHEQLQTALEELKKNRQQKEKMDLRKTELISAFNTVLPAVDVSFDVLLGLHKKRVDWTQLENDTKAWGTPLSFRAQSLPPLDLDYSKATAAVKAQVAKETAKETFEVLKTVHAYFMDLKPEEDIGESSPNFEHVKALLLAYYTLNDLLLAKAVGDKDSKKELAFLEEKLKFLSDATAFKVEVAPLMAPIEAAVGECNGLDEARAVFLDRMKQF